MKKAGFLAASIAAAASSAACVFGQERRAAAQPSFSSDEGSRGSGKEAGSRRGRGEEKFAPRFDGLRFIETLVTAHR
ncbi:hypothetical protein COCNU_07G014250 [Cocos nucifera]|uniref:Uncharacterized protein n=1 Tax=Cocos nucifera TaxID=13894 RepID=A0A8K0IGF0_COCNU|nr:hypothetical protein COCNU_07G014250 [Cocos nucifera]